MLHPATVVPSAWFHDAWPPVYTHTRRRSMGKEEINERREKEEEKEAAKEKT